MTEPPINYPEIINHTATSPLWGWAASEMINHLDAYHARAHEDSPPTIWFPVNAISGYVTTQCGVIYEVYMAGLLSGGMRN